MNSMYFLHSQTSFNWAVVLRSQWTLHLYSNTAFMTIWFDVDRAVQYHTMKLFHHYLWEGGWGLMLSHTLLWTAWNPLWFHQGLQHHFLVTSMEPSMVSTCYKLDGTIIRCYSERNEGSAGQADINHQFFSLNLRWQSCLTLMVLNSQIVGVQYHHATVRGGQA